MRIASHELYLGLDCSTQSLTAVLIDTAKRRIVAQRSVVYDRELPRFGTRNGQLPHRDPRVGVAPPLMWAAALDLLLERLTTESGRDLAAVRGVAVSGQQHGSVYLNAQAAQRLSSLDPGAPLEAQLQSIFSRPVAPLWTDSTTSEECEELRRALGGAHRVAELTGSDAFERFTGAQIRRFAKLEPEAWADTESVALVSSFLTSILCGAPAPIDHGDGSGMNLMDIRSREWSEAAIGAVGHGVGSRLPPLVPSDRTVGTIAPYFRRYGLERCDVVAGSGDNPCSLVGVGAIAGGEVTLSLGTSDTFFATTPELRSEATDEGHIFVAPTGDYFCLLCFRNGALARERVRERFGLDWSELESAVAETPPGNCGRLLVPWFEQEIVPRTQQAGARAFGGLDPEDAGQLCRAVLEGQFSAIRIHTRAIAEQPSRVLVTGGASRNRAVLQIVANVFQCPAIPSDRPDTAALGAALRAHHGSAAAGGRRLPWDDVVRDFCAPTRPATMPQPGTSEPYARLLAAYQRAEASARADEPAGVRLAI